MYYNHIKKASIEEQTDLYYKYIPWMINTDLDKIIENITADAKLIHTDGLDMSARVSNWVSNMNEAIQKRQSSKNIESELDLLANIKITADKINTFDLEHKEIEKYKNQLKNDKGIDIKNIGVIIETINLIISTQMPAYITTVEAILRDILPKLIYHNEDWLDTAEYLKGLNEVINKCPNLASDIHTMAKYIIKAYFQLILCQQFKFLE
jgi:hypothetical protein